MNKKGQLQQILVGTGIVFVIAGALMLYFGLTGNSSKLTTSGAIAILIGGGVLTIAKKIG